MCESRSSTWACAWAVSGRAKWNVPSAAAKTSGVRRSMGFPGGDCDVRAGSLADGAAAANIGRFGLWDLWRGWHRLHGVPLPPLVSTNSPSRALLTLLDG